MRKFKIGDWVRIKDKDFNAKFQIDLIDEFGNLFDHNQTYKGEQKYWELWKLRNGEWIVVNLGNKNALITKFDKNAKYVGIEPFIDELPRFLRK